MCYWDFLNQMWVMCYWDVARALSVCRCGVADTNANAAPVTEAPPVRCKLPLRLWSGVPKIGVLLVGWGEGLVTNGESLAGKN